MSVIWVKVCSTYELGGSAWLIVSVAGTTVVTVWVTEPAFSQQTVCPLLTRIGVGENPPWSRASMVTSAPAFLQVFPPDGLLHPRPIPSTVAASHASRMRPPRDDREP